MNTPAQDALAAAEKAAAEMWQTLQDASAFADACRADWRRLREEVKRLQPAALVERFATWLEEDRRLCPIPKHGIEEIDHDHRRRILITFHHISPNGSLVLHVEERAPEWGTPQCSTRRIDAKTKSLPEWRKRLGLEQT